MGSFILGHDGDRGLVRFQTCRGHRRGRRRRRRIQLSNAACALVPATVPERPIVACFKHVAFSKALVAEDLKDAYRVPFWGSWGPFGSPGVDLELQGSILALN